MIHASATCHYRLGLAAKVCFAMRRAFAFTLRFGRLIDAVIFVPPVASPPLTAALKKKPGMKPGSKQLSLRTESLSVRLQWMLCKHQ
jgi:hypothetical protein